MPSGKIRHAMHFPYPTLNLCIGRRRFHYSPEIINQQSITSVPYTFSRSLCVCVIACSHIYNSIECWLFYLKWYNIMLFSTVLATSNHGLIPKKAWNCHCSIIPILLCTVCLYYVCLSVALCLSVCLSVCLSISLSLSFSLSLCLSPSLSLFLSAPPPPLPEHYQPGVKEDDRATDDRCNPAFLEK